MLMVIKRILIILAAVTVVVFGIHFVKEHFMDDNKPPVLTCDSDILEISTEDGEDALKAGLRAIDDRDGDITENIYVKNISRLISKDTAKITYIVFDSSDNMASLSRLLRYTDYEKPHFAIVQPLVYSSNTVIVLKERLKAYDVVDGDISGSIKLTSSSLDNNAEGVYHVTVQVMNSFGDTSTLLLPIQIYDWSIYDPKIELTDYLVYVEAGSKFEPTDYIRSVMTLRNGGKKVTDYSTLLIDSAVDTATPGCYDVNYTYENENGRKATAILTVAVE